MKRILSMLIVLTMLLGCSVAMAEMGVQVIGGPDTETEPVSLDDIKLNEGATIDGYAIFTATAYTVQDNLGYYKQGKTKPDGDWWYRSGKEAEYVILRVDLTTLATREKLFLENAEVKVVYDDTYEYAGWAYQLNYDNGTSDWSGGYGTYNKIQNTEFVIDAADNFAIGPMYAGHYFFGCTLPNAVIEGKAPLRMVINLDGNEITYNVRK